jgi:hypothetical protein
MSTQPRLYLPNGTRPSGDWAPKPKPKSKSGKLLPTNLWETMGRKFGIAHGSYMDDLSANHKTIWLCWSCKHKFDYKKVHYFYEKNLRVRGNCDGCRRFDVNSHLFIHESTLTDPGGKSRHGHVWTPR